MARSLYTKPNANITKNHIINGNFDIWQRGTSFASTGSGLYTADRWYLFSVSGATASQQTPGNSSSRFAMKVQRNSGQTFTSGIAIAQPFETQNIVALRGKYVTVSFYAKAGANFSASSQLLSIQLASGTGAESKNIGGSFTSSTALVSTTQAVTTTLTKYTFTSSVTVPTTATQMELYFSFTPVGTAGADDSFTIEQVMINEGVEVSPFKLSEDDPIAEFYACLRYYESVYIGSTSSFGWLITLAGGTGGTEGSIFWKVQKRVTPSITTNLDTLYPGNHAATVVFGVNNARGSRFNTTSSGLTTGTFYTYAFNTGEGAIIADSEI